MNLKLVLINKLAAESGYTLEALHSKIARGDFIEGIHYIKARDGRIHFYVEEYLKWVESNNMVRGSKSRSTGMESATAQH